MLIAISASVVALTPGVAAAQQWSSSVVSADGDDGTGNCRPATPCRDVSKAIEKTVQGGVVNLIGPLELGRIYANREHSFIASGNVNITGIDLYGHSQQQILIKGLNFNSGTSAVAMRLGGSVLIKDCTISGYGETFADGAIAIAGARSSRVVIEDSSIRNSVYGVVVDATQGGTHSVLISDSMIDRNTRSAVEVRGANAVAVISGSTLSGSGGLDLSLIEGGRAISYRNNVIRTGTPTQTLPTN